MTDWAQRYLELAHLVATWSKDPSTQVGAVAVGPDKEVLSMGYNGFPRGMNDAPERYADRAFKYQHIQHAEANAILNAARNGLSLKGTVLYVTHPPCPHCAGMLRQAGIERVVYARPAPDFLERWPLNDTYHVFHQTGLGLTEYPYEHHRKTGSQGPVPQPAGAGL